MCADKNRRVLVIDDNRSIHDDFRKILSPVTDTEEALDVTETELFGQPTETVLQTRFEVDSAYQGEEGLLLIKKALEAGRPYALAFIDVRMPPGWDGVETTRKIWEFDPNLQVVLCTAYSDYSWDEVFENLAHRDGLLILKKPFDSVEAFQLASALTEKWWLHQETQRKMEELEDRVAERTGELQHTNHALQTEVAEHQRAIGMLRESNEKFHQLADNITDAFWIRSPDLSVVHYISPAFERIWGRSVESLYAHPHQWIDFIHPEDRERVEGAFAALTGDTPSLDIEYRIMRPDGEVRWVRVRGFQVRDAAGKLIRHTGIVTDVTERRQAVEKLRESKRFAESIAENSTSIIYLYDLETRRSVYSNRNAAEALGYSHAEVVAMGENFLPAKMHPEDLPRILQQHAEYAHVTDNRVFDLEFRLKDAGGNWHWMWSRETVFNRRPNGAAWQILGSAQDITERKRMEVGLFQSQKMETVGKLAGGVAHEFNSILTAIIGQSELLIGKLPADSPLVKNVAAISRAAVRAATLTRQLLAYGRKQTLLPEVLDLNTVLADMEETLRHLMTRNADVSIVPGSGLKQVKADARQIEQVIMNLALNARDAMPNGGKLMVETANVSIDEESVGGYPELKPGDYVMLAVTDTGTGMSEATKARAFEPFFTTKGVGEGSGLGLSTCYGIIKQSGGHISLYTELGRGTTFKIYLPQVEQEVMIPVQRPASSALPRGTETILLVEDDADLREMAATLLRQLGYTVWVAADGIEALNLKQQRDTGYIDLLLTDVVMPHMSGKELADRVRALNPHTQILFTSAYTENAIVHQGVMEKGVVMLQKPFTPSALAHKLRELLDQAVANHPS
ncbi:MAG: PAS domain-containing protein [Chthoniobacter sp.]|uniref:PAS domain-containing protein n=1 Tax=Chthoniobacter sp. TaxID=2510640 RepID=UPI0032A50EBD